MSVCTGHCRQALPHVGRRAVTPKDRSGLLQPAVGGQDAGPNGTDCRVVGGGAEQRSEASVGHRAVVVEEHEEVGPGHGCSLIAPGGETQILPVHHQDDVLVPSQAVKLVARRAVRHDDELGPGRTGTWSPQSIEAVQCQVRLLQHQDADRKTRIVWHPGPSPHGWFRVDGTHVWRSLGHGRCASTNQPVSSRAESTTRPASSNHGSSSAHV